MLRSRIAAVGGFVPPKVVTNEDLTQFIETSDDWILQRTGIQERRWCEGQTTSDLAFEASKEAIARANLSVNAIDLIIFATLSPDHDFPGSGCFLQAKLGLEGVPALDIRQQCSGFLYGLSIADLYIRSGTYKHVLLVGSEVHSTGLDKSTRGRDVTVLFGDGAGAAVISATEVKDKATDPHIFSTHLHADGTQAKELWMPAPGSAMGAKDRITEEMVREGMQFPQMNGKRVFAAAVRKMSEVVLEALSANQLTKDDVDLFLFHQANLRINEAVAQQLEIPWDKVFNTIHKYGNTTAATLPLGWKDAEAEGKLKPGMLVAMAAFGSGFTWAASVVRS